MAVSRSSQFMVFIIVQVLNSGTADLLDLAMPSELASTQLSMFTKTCSH